MKSDIYNISIKNSSSALEKTLNFLTRRQGGLRAELRGRQGSGSIDETMASQEFVPPAYSTAKAAVKASPAAVGSTERILSRGDAPRRAA